MTTKTKEQTAKETVPDGFTNWKEMALSYKSDLTDLPLPVLKIDEHYTITYINTSGADLIGLPREEVVGQKCYDLLKTKHCRTPDCRCSQAMQNDNVFTAENVSYQEGRDLKFRNTARPIKNAKGEVVGAIESLVDTSDVDFLMEEAQKKINDLNSIPAPVFRIDKDFNVQFINKHGAEMCGHTQDTALGMKCYDLLKTPHCNSAECRTRQAMEQGTLCTGETVFDPEGANTPIKYLAREVRNDSGEIVGATELVLDITSEKETEHAVVNTTDTLNGIVDEIADISVHLNEKSGVISERANSVAVAAEQMSTSMMAVSTAAEQSQANINSVATSTEEMTSTVGEIAQNSERARSMTENAVKSAAGATSKVNELGSAAKEISKVIETIVEIAEQTKLLALNATIEAARAGEAGKGFAVVASEVKELAKQTNSATEDIRSKIEAIQGSTESTVSEIGHINTVINEVNENVSSIATAVEEQSITTKEIAKNITQASDGISEMTSSVIQSAGVAKNVAADINSVNDNIATVTDTASSLAISGGKLKCTNDQLMELLARFREE